MSQFAFAIEILAVLSLGLAAGALLAEACILVPLWRSQKPESFLKWYKQNADLLLRFFGPLEIASTVLIIGATVLAWLNFLPGRDLLSASMGLTIAVLASFPVYFKGVNAQFAQGSIPVTEVSGELRRWAMWHWGRTILATVAFMLALVALTA